MGLEFLANLLSALPGTVVYHILVFLGLLPAAGIVLTEWWHTRNSELKPYMVGLSGVMAVHLISAILAPMSLEPMNAAAIISAPLMYAGNLLSILLLLWAFGLRLWGSHRWRLLGYFVAGWSVLLAIAFLEWRHQATRLPVTYAVHSWQVPMWYLLSAAAAFVGMWILARWDEEAPIVAPLAFSFFGMGSLLGVWGSRIWEHPLLVGEGLGRLFYLIGYPLFALLLYDSALRDLQSYREELKELSQEALRQSQELLFLIEATRSIGEVLDLSGMLGKVVDSVAMALRADTVAIFLTGEEESSMQMAALYQVLRPSPRLPREIDLKAYPILSAAMKRRLTFSHQDNLSRHRPFLELIQVSGGPMMLQPLQRQDRTMGVIVVCNDGSQADFSPEQERLLTTMAVQIAGAVENSRLYQALDAKAKELSHLLTVREAELRREEAILESMAEGILVADAQGKVILINRATEEILDLDRETILRRTVGQLLESPALQGEVDPKALLEIERPFRTVFELNDRKIRVHASPVMMGDGERLGVVAILQDITREYLAEEAKREFIASISHELRTPLTAIRGYTEVMLAGMGGELPKSITHFLDVIWENTARMSTLTDNIISIAEIERGQIGLNYQQVNMQELAEEIIKRYRRSLAERNMKLEVDFPDDLPEVEADPYRMRLVLDNLLSNAIRFTYPGGRVTVGCRTIVGPMNEPLYLSLWVSDTGVGIPADEIPRIWERFYRVENPLSLEAGGLGIGLTITKALVEAHGGRVWVESTPGKGSTFTVLIPVRRDIVPMPGGGEL